jgi:hypothetical protein
MRIEPTVGNIVWFYRANQGPRAAIITHVHSNREVNLCVFSEEGDGSAETNVPFVQKEDRVGDGIYCRSIP